MNPLAAALSAIEQILLGKPAQIRLCLACLLARGHLLIEDVPGVGKTTLAHTLARVLGLEWRRLQFTSDLLPADVLGTALPDSLGAGVDAVVAGGATRSASVRAGLAQVPDDCSVVLARGLDRIAGWLVLAGVAWLGLCAWAAITFLGSTVTGSTAAAAGIGAGGSGGRSCSACFSICATVRSASSRRPRRPGSARRRARTAGFGRSSRRRPTSRSHGSRSRRSRRARWRRNIVSPHPTPDR